MSNGDHDTLVPQELLVRLFQRKVVPFLGAGCSVPAPSQLPTADELARALVERGAGEDGQALEDIAEAVWAQGDWQAFAQVADEPPIVKHDGHPTTFRPVDSRDAHERTL